MNDYLTDFASLFAQYDVPGAFWVNLQLTFWAAIGSAVLGALIALMRISPIASLRLLGTTYVNLFRNTPLTIILVFLVLGVWSQLGINLSSDFNRNFFLYAVIGLSLYHAAFVCEAIRSGVNTVPAGQAEAARAIGLSFLPAARLIVFPQALRGAITPLGNTLIALTKNTTVAAAASVTEISSLMKTMIEFRPDVIIAIFLVVALGFVLIVVPVGLLTTWASRKLAVKR
ncbi:MULTISPECIES: amino acid ABC transporter permease [Kocuria]|uniref:amino acid ABC transporter permease n=1 Tax=Kocuria TaxID=57493 RepID=UPI000363D17A|nr:MULTISPECIES: amino acid ABC transporter permease [Kocuria]MCC5784515.1 amino acid ABC transporter permease [Kocuria sp. CCUG 69068]NVC23579.1 amino acid ABC transporter permease [Kocuria salina]MCM3484150.1 amino acid ABC transporter permease [Kocuria rosea]MEB2526689.1 amino acid ABC transporter permease [Kocuria rosea]MEB2618919.1 amino acid ABC transporter permease [Kocuria rosea]